MQRDDTFLIRKNGFRLILALSLMGLLSAEAAPTSFLPGNLRSGIAEAHDRMSPWKVDSSVKIPEATLTQAINEARSAFNRILAPYAKISLSQAHKIAQDSEPQATVKDISLQTIRQNLVYVAVMMRGDTRQLVVIDAGTGKILATRTINVRHQMREHEHGNLMY